jgi:tRNA threonylcarbamoyladenosine dehydratase
MALDFRSHKVQLVATAIGASVVTASALTAYTQFTRREKRKHLDEYVRNSIASGKSNLDINSASASLNASRSLTPPPVTAQNPPVDFQVQFDEDLIREQLARNYAFFGDTGMAKIRGGSVVIVGCGGVGSWAAVMLARS